MNVQIRSKDVIVGDSSKAHIQSAVETFKKYSLDITSVKCMINAEKHGISVEFNISIAHAEPVVINQKDDVLDAAIDLAIERVTKALRRLHDRMVSKKITSIKEMNFQV